MQKKHHKLNHSKKNHQNHKLKQLNTSVFDFLHWHQRKTSLENKNKHQQQQESFPYRPSIIKSSDIARVLPRKSVRFGAVSDIIDNEHDKDEMNFNFETNTIDRTILEEDLVIVIPNKQFSDEKTIDSSENIEPYPFRSEIPLSLSSQSSSSIDVTTTSHHPRKKIIRHFIPPHRPKKLPHPIHITDPVNKINGSTSTPNLLSSSSLSLPSTTNDQQDRLKPIRTWFKLSSVGRFLESFGKDSHQDQSNHISKSKKKPPHHQSTELNEFSEFIY